jgi:hypothetical protein
MGVIPVVPKPSKNDRERRKLCTDERRDSYRIHHAGSAIVAFWLPEDEAPTTNEQNSFATYIYCT